MEVACRLGRSWFGRGTLDLQEKEGLMIGLAEGALLATFTGLYLYDSLLLFNSNDAALVRRGNGTWVAGFGSNRTTLKGKEPFVPNPLLPARPIYRLAWRIEGENLGDVTRWEHKADDLKRFVPLVWILFALAFVALPWVLVARAGDLFVLLAFLLIYAAVFSIILLLGFRRQSVGVSRKQVAWMAFDFLICPPFALNVIRRLSLLTPVSEDFVSAAERLLQPSDWRIARSELIARLDEEIDSEDEDSSRSIAMKVRRSLLRVEEYDVSA
jgi:hypothetical protein